MLGSPWLWLHAHHFGLVDRCCWPCPMLQFSAAWTSTHFFWPWGLVKWIPRSLCFLNPVITAEGKSKSCWPDHSEPFLGLLASFIKKELWALFPTPSCLFVL